MSALTLPVDDGNLDTSHDPASDRRRVINNDGSPDRRKVVHRGSRPTSSGGSDDGPAPDHDAAPPDRRKIIHREPAAARSVTCTTGGSEDGPAPDHDAAPPDRRKVVHQRPAQRAALAASLGGIRATAEDVRLATAMDDDTGGDGGRGVGTRLVETARGLAATLMLLAMLGSVVGGALPVHTDGHDASAETSAHVDVQEANVATGLFSLWALAVSGWNALTGSDICDDCNLPVDDGCKCVCYSGGYDPDDPACQF